MVKYIIKRLLLSLLILFGVSVILYVLVRMMPLSFVDGKLGDPSQEGYEEKKLALYAYYGLEPKPTFWGVVSGYFGWFTKFITGDFGRSFKYDMAVETVIFKNMGLSFLVSFVSLILQLVIAIPLGIRCACNQYGKLDYFATVLTMIGISFPSFFFGSLLIKIFSVGLGWFPVNGLTSSFDYGVSDWTIFWDRAWHLVLPIFVLVILSVGSMMRYTRTNTLEVPFT